MKMFGRQIVRNFTIITGFVLYVAMAAAAEGTPDAPPRVLTLDDAAMCEGIESYQPRFPAVVFSVTNGRVAAFTAFDPVPRKTVIYHRWYFKDTLTTTKKLHLKPPKWATYSSIQLRQADIGPWRVEIIGSEGDVMKVMRFSVTE